MVCAALLWAAMLVGPNPSIDVGVIVHDPATGRTAALRLSDSPSIDDRDFGGSDGAFWVRLSASQTSGRVLAGAAAGYAAGEASAVDELERVAAAWPGARVSVAGLITRHRVAVFAGDACPDCVVARRRGVVVLGAGVDEPDAEAVARRVGLDGGDVVLRLLRFADAVADVWPHPAGPRSAMLIAVGPGRAREAIAVDTHGDVGRRLWDRHLRHLADVEVPFELEQARAAWSTGDEEGLEVHRRRALAAARRALEAFPRDRLLRRRLRQADSLLNEHLTPTP